MRVIVAGSNRSVLYAAVAINPCFAINDMKRQIEVSGPAVRNDRIQGQARQIDLPHRSILKDKHHLEERVAAQIALET